MMQARSLVLVVTTSLTIAAAALFACTGADPTPATALPDGGSAGDSGGTGEDAGGHDAGADAERPVCDASPCVVEISAGGAHTCARTVDGAVRCWGANGFGESGTGARISADGGPSESVDPATVPTPVVVAGITNATVLGTGGSYRASGVSCVGTSDLAMRCWGIDSWGQLGRGGDAGAGEVLPRPARPEPAPVAAIQNVVDVSVGVNDTCAVIKHGSVACWGSDESGQLGYTGSGQRVPTPAVVAIAKSFARVVTRGHHSVALTEDGHVWLWGDNADAQCAKVAGGTVLPFELPTSGYVGVSAGRNHSCALDGTGKVYCWGRSVEGQLGRATPPALPTTDPTPGLVAFGAGEIVKQIAGDQKHNCALLADGTVKCWGQLLESGYGTGMNQLSMVPTAVPLPARATQIAAGFEHACALLEGGSVYCWGSNVSGELGRGQTGWPLYDLVPGPVAFSP